MQASLDTTGKVLSWNHEIFSPPHLGRSRVDEEYSGLLAAWYLEEPLLKPPLNAGLWNNGGSHRNADPIYTFHEKRIIKHVQLDPALRVSSFRGLGSVHECFRYRIFH